MANIFQKVLAARDAINYGESLSNPGIWSDRAAASSAVAGILGVATVFAPSFQLSPDDLQAIAGGIAAVGGVLNWYLHSATNKDAGVRRKK